MTAAVFRAPESLDLKPPKPPITWPLVVFALFGVLGGFLSIVMWDGLTSLVMAAVAGWFLLLTWAFGRLMRDVQYREARVLTGSDALTFIPSASMGRVDSLVAGALWVPWVLLVLTMLVDGADAHLSLVERGIIGGVPVIYAYHLWQLRSPRGLTLTPDGIRGVRRGPALSLAWEDIADVSVMELPGRGKLRIDGRDGKSVSIDSTRFGSDASVVAHVLEHFLANPRQRPELAMGEKSLQRFGLTRVGAA